MEIKIVKEMESNRLDAFLTEKLGETRSVITKAIKNGNILVNENAVKPGYKLRENDIVEVLNLHEETDIKPEKMDLNIVYEDEYIIVVNKPSGLTVHPGSGNYNNTLVNGLIYHTKNLSDASGEDRPGIVHRIDKDTSGLLLISKSNKVHNILADMFKKHTIKRKYTALVYGVLKHDKGKIDAPIGRSDNDRKKMAVTSKNSKDAITNFIVKERYKDATLIECILETGRTHQIRVHMSYIKHPIINDPVYNKKTINKYGQMLHAGYLGFNHPITNEFMEFSVEPESEFEEILETFKNS